MIKKLKLKFFFNTTIFWITFIFYFSLLFNPNNKTLFLAFLVLAFLYYKYLKDFRFSLLLTTISSLIILVGKTYIIELIPPNPYISTEYPTGFNTFIVLQIKDILITGMLFIIIRDILVNKKISLPFAKPTFFLLLFYLWQILTSLIASKKPELSLIYCLQEATSFILFLYILLYGIKHKMFIKGLISIIIAMIFFEGILVGLQLLNHNHLGLVIEPAQEVELYGAGVDEDYFFYRPIGTFHHANSLAAFSLPFIFIFLAFINFFVFRLALVTSFLILVVSLGRSAWISFIFGLLLYLYFLEKKWKLKIMTINIKKIWAGLNLNYTFLLIFLLGLFTYMISPRIINSFYLFNETGGGWTRIIMAKEALNLIEQYPIFGVGLAMGPVEVFNFDPRTIATHFFSGVHNGFLSLALESGLVGLCLFLIFIYFSMRGIINNLRKLNLEKRIISLGGITAIMALMINALFQPFFNFDFMWLIIVFLYGLNYN